MVQIIIMNQNAELELEVEELNCTSFTVVFFFFLSKITKRSIGGLQM